MIQSLGHAGTHRRVAINVGAGFVPGTNAVILGAALAGGRLGWEMVGIRNGFEGLLHPDRYPDGGLVTLSPALIEDLDPATGGILGQAPWADPLHSRSADGDQPAGEADLSDELLRRLNAAGIDSLISIVGVPGLSILQSLYFKGLHTVCIPRSIENDIACTAVSFGFNTALSVTVEMLNKAFQAARSARKIAVVEVTGEHAGWIALQAGIAARADAVLIPEIPCKLKSVAARLKDKISPRRPYGLVVIAEGARIEFPPPELADKHDIRTSNPENIRPATGQLAGLVASSLQELTSVETYPLVTGAWARGGNPTALDHQLGMAFGAGAVQALKGGGNGVMMSFAPPDIKSVPLADAVNKRRTVPADSEFLRIGLSLGIYPGIGL